MSAVKVTFDDSLTYSDEKDAGIRHERLARSLRRPGTK